MNVFNYKTIQAEKAECCQEETQVRWLITKEMGAPNFAMRLFEMKPNGHSPLHKHAWEHEVFVLEGKGQILTEKTRSPCEPATLCSYPRTNCTNSKTTMKTP